MRNPLGKHVPLCNPNRLLHASFFSASFPFWRPQILFSTAQSLFWRPRYLVSTAQIPFRLPRYLVSTARYLVSTTQIPFRRPRSSITTVHPSIPPRCNHPRAACLASAITIPPHTRLEMCRFRFMYTRRSHDTQVCHKQTLRPNDARRAPRGATHAYAHQEMTVRRAAWAAPASMQTNARG